MFKDHPVAAWSSVVVTLLTLAASTAGGWYFIVSTRGALETQGELLTSIRAEQESIRRELTEQTADLEAIKNTQAGFSELRAGQQWLSTIILGVAE